MAKAVELGIINGKGEKIFDTNGNLTRAQMAKIISLPYDLTGNSGTEFSDVPPTHWAYSYIQGEAKNQVTFGIDTESMVGNHYITGAQFAVMMARRLDESFRVVPTPPIGVSPGFLKQRCYDFMQNKKIKMADPHRFNWRVDFIWRNNR